MVPDRVSLSGLLPGRPAGGRRRGHADSLSLAAASLLGGGGPGPDAGPLGGGVEFSRASRTPGRTVHRLRVGWSGRAGVGRLDLLPRGPRLAGVAPLARTRRA